MALNRITYVVVNPGNSTLLRTWKRDIADGVNINGQVLNLHAENTIKIVLTSGPQTGQEFTGIWAYQLQDQRTHYADVTVQTSTGVTFDLYLRDTAADAWEIFNVPAIELSSFHLAYGALPTNLAAPTLTLGAVTESSIGLTWSTVANATGYKLYRSTTSGTTGYTQVGGVFSSTNMTNIELLPNTTYWYRMVATDANGDSAFSNVVSATTLGAPVGPTQTNTPTITLNSGNTITRQQYEFRGTAEANAVVEIDIGTTILSTTASAQGAWQINPTAWIATNVTQIRVRATAPSKSASNWSSYAQLTDAPNTARWAMPYQSGSTYQAYLVSFSGTAAAPGNITRSTLISPAPRNTITEARNDINTYFDAN